MAVAIVSAIIGLNCVLLCLNNSIARSPSNFEVSGESFEVWGRARMNRFECNIEIVYTDKINDV